MKTQCLQLIPHSFQQLLKNLAKKFPSLSPTLLAQIFFLFGDPKKYHGMMYTTLRLATKKQLVYRYFKICKHCENLAMAVRSQNLRLKNQGTIMDFDKEKYKVWKLPNPTLLHWVINPVVTINELILGQRMPKVTLIDKSSDAPLMERQSIPCPKCNTLNDARIWSNRNAFGHWFGLICPKCYAKIPCLWNISSIIILVLTFPIWIWIKIFGEAKWLKIENRRLSKILATELPRAKQTNWIKMGLSYGIIMFFIMVLPKAIQNQLTLNLVIILALVWLATGLAFGLFMKRHLNSRELSHRGK